jgi:hypothetical protein
VHGAQCSCTQDQTQDESRADAQMQRALGSASLPFSGLQVAGYESDRNSQAQKVSTWNENRTGLQNVSDPMTGAQFQVFSGPRANSFVNGNRVKINADVSRGPDFQESSRELAAPRRIVGNKSRPWQSRRCRSLFGRRNLGSTFRSALTPPIRRSTIRRTAGGPRAAPGALPHRRVVSDFTIFPSTSA